MTGLSPPPEHPILHGNGIVGIRREDKNEWEHRVALVPNDVAILVREGIRVIVQPSGLRAYSDQEYLRVGAEIGEDLSECGTIIGVKEVPPHKILPGKTWCFFTHTIKGQDYAMPLLDRLLDTGVRVVDYERITNDKGGRLVFFGLYAGYAGMIDTLTALGLTLIKRGFTTPFLNVVWSKHYSDLTTAKNDCYLAGARIKQQGLPAGMGPCVMVVTGSGNSAQGAIEILNTLPIIRVTVDELPGLRKNYKDNAIYLCQVTTADFIVPLTAGDKFDKADYYANPTKYRCVFEERILPYATVIVNCIFWDRRYPRLVTRDGIEAAAKAAPNGCLPLTAVGDISCDIGGSIEFVTEATTIENPIFYYEPTTQASTPTQVSASSIAVCSIDHLPSELPRSSSEFFSRQLRPFVRPLALADANTEPEESSQLPPEIARAVLCQHGKLTKAFKYIDDIRNKRGDVRGRGPKDDHVVIFGSGRMVAPCLEYLLRTSDTLRVTVASLIIAEANHLCLNSKGRAVPVKVSVSDEPSAVEALVSTASAVVSLLPAPLHPYIAKPCVRNGVSLVTASYITEELFAMSKAAEANGVTVLGEMGLDPGIDHMSAMKMIDEAHLLGAKVLGFVSWCGGLPAPQHADNPLRYKFSWAPKSAVIAGRNAAKYLWDGELKEVPGPQLFRSARSVDICPAFAFEGYPNRDAMGYIKDYGLEGIKTMFRGTLRFGGYARLMYGLTQAGFLSLDNNMPCEDGTTWLAATGVCLGVAPGGACTEDAVVAALRAKLSATCEPECVEATVEGARWLGLLDAATPCPQTGTMFDAVCDMMEHRMAYAPRETDLVHMHHELEIELPSGRRETWVSSLSELGTRGGATAMAKTVGLPVGIAVRMLLDGKIQTRGVLRPTIKEIYEPALELLSKEGVVFFESHKESPEKRSADFSVPVL